MTEEPVGLAPARKQIRVSCSVEHAFPTFCDWASILVFEPPSRIVLEWKVNPARPPTELEVTFEPDRDGTLGVLSRYVEATARSY